MDGKPTKQFYHMGADEALVAARSRAGGLSAAEARERLAADGPNALDIRHKTPLPVTFLRQFKDLMIMLLIASSVVSFALGDARTAYVLLALVLFNTTIGFLQEFKAGRVMESLERLVTGEATVLRDGGKKVYVPYSDVAMGDIVYVEEGNAVPADIRLLRENELSTNDFALTGESNPVRKFTHALVGEVPLASRHNLAFMGTTVATGQAYGLVIGTGMPSAIVYGGKIIAL